MSYQENGPTETKGLWHNMSRLFSNHKVFMSPQQLRTKMKRQADNLLIVDIRSKSSFDEFHLPGAISVPPDGWNHLHNKAFGADKEIVVVCQQGVMSREAVRILRERGFQKVMALRGGMELWEENYAQR